MISACSRPLNGRSIAVEMDSAQLKARFVAVVQKYGFDVGAKSDEVTLTLTLTLTLTPTPTLTLTLSLTRLP